EARNEVPHAARNEAPHGARHDGRHEALRGTPASQVIPSRTLLLLALAPVVLALAALADETLLWPMVALDAGVLVGAAVGAAWGFRSLVGVERETPDVFSVGRWNLVTLELRSHARRRLRVELVDDLFEAAEREETPGVVELAARGRAVLHYRVRPGRRG